MAKKKTAKDKIYTNLKRFQKAIDDIYHAAAELEWNESGTDISDEIDALLEKDAIIESLEKDVEYFSKELEKLHSSNNKEHDKIVNELTKNISKFRLQNEKLIEENKKLKETLGTFQFIKQSITVSPTKAKKK